ncbi:flagellar biosynthesis protein FlhA [Vibrio harveyi]|nr:flagellar biosynthesis protein FlhA [Vibrio harveyi]
MRMKEITNIFYKGKIGVPILLMTILAMVILPIPPIVLDTLFTFNIVLALMVMLVAVYSKKPLDFSVFPSVLLIATLLRLGLNVASTRVVLLYGHEGGDAAGKVIQSFGDVVIGGNYVVGMVVFIILMIINFVVVTKGGERISEVSARFTLDAMPGKQMAIDADLNAGIIDHFEAKSRRAQVATEADFYGSMDGASKFVRGDAIAGMLILFINIIGGISIGVFSHGLDFSTAFKTYALLTIGDGLVAQIPSLLLATSAAIIVTRVTDNSDLSNQIKKQLLASPTVIFIVAILMLVLGIIPGMPHIAFITFSITLGAVGWKLHNINKSTVINHDLAAAESIAEKLSVSNDGHDIDIKHIPNIHSISVLVGYRLVELIDRSQGAELLSRLAGIRKTMSEKRGILIPKIHVKDDLSLEQNQYRIKIKDSTVTINSLEIGNLLAINSGNVFGDIDGILTKDPAYNLDAVWIKPQNKDHAINLGYTVVDHATIISTHLCKMLNEQIEDVVGLDVIDDLIDRLRDINSKLADDLCKNVSTQLLLRIVKQLAIENIPMNDIVTIANSLVESSQISQDPILLSSDVRCAMRRKIINDLVGIIPEIPVVTLSSELEGMLLSALSQAQSTGHIQLDGFPLEPSLIEKIQRNLSEVLESMKLSGYCPILLVMPQLRPLLSRYARVSAKGLNVLSFNEIPDDRNISVVGNI